MNGKPVIEQSRPGLGDENEKGRTISATRTRPGAYRAIDAFESGFRSFIAAKLSTAHVPNWFKHRVP